MSYEIMYDRKFIRTTRGFIPMILSGSNNCTEIRYSLSGRRSERRERHWWAWIPKSMPFKDHTEAEYLKQIDILTKDTPNHELFRWNGNWLTDRQWRKWFQKGCKAALTLEEYRASNRVCSFVGYISVNYGIDEPDATELKQYIHTTEELEHWLDQANAKVKEIHEAATGKCATYISLEWDINEPLDVPAVAPVGAVVAKNGDRYLVEYEKGKRLVFNSDAAAAIVFPSVEEAKEQIGLGWKKLRFVNAERQMRERNFVLMANTGIYSGCYIRRRTKNYLHFTRLTADAKRYATKAEAIRYAKELAMRFTVLGNSIALVNLKDATCEEICIREEAA